MDVGVDADRGHPEAEPEHQVGGLTTDPRQLEERALLGDRTWLAVCMKTYMKLGEGPGRVWRRPGELPLCIGTDGAASSNTLSPFVVLESR